MEPVPATQEKPSIRRRMLSPAGVALVAGMVMATIAWTSGWSTNDDVSIETFPVDTAQPVFHGRTATGITQAHFTLLPNRVSWTGPVDPETGEFETTIPIPLAPGTYALYLDDALVSRFALPEEAAGP